MKVEGCTDAKADWEEGWAWAKYDPERTNPEELIEAVNETTPFQAAPLDEAGSDDGGADSAPKSDDPSST